MTVTTSLPISTKTSGSSLTISNPTYTYGSGGNNTGLFNNSNTNPMSMNMSAIINLLMQLIASFRGSAGTGGLFGGSTGLNGSGTTLNLGGNAGSSSSSSGSTINLGQGGSTNTTPSIIPINPIPINPGAIIWGDPHFVGAEGESYDIKGEAGKTYNILSDKNLQLNAAFRAMGSTQTLIGALGATIKNENGIYNIKFTEKGELTVNSQVLKDGNYQLGSSTIKKQGTNLTLKTPEYEITSGLKNNELSLNFKSDNVATDGIMPHGFWGQTADGDGKKRDGEQGDKAQGGGVLEKLDGTIAAKGDTKTYKLYEVKDLFDTNFTNFNRFNGTSGYVGNAKVAASGSAD